MEMNKCCFVIPYFGKFNNYFPLYLKSCTCNNDFNWLIITDDKKQYDYPPNVKVLYWTFEETVQFIMKRFNCFCNIKNPYKLCDYKPMYGYIFEEYLKEYYYWGFCDTDIILGNLSKFITVDMLKEYDKIFCLGHLTLIKNTFENNRIFMNEIAGERYYKKVLSTDYNLIFDEEGVDEYNINSMFLKAGKKIFEEDLSLNINIRYPYLLRTIRVSGFSGTSQQFVNEKYRTSICIWDRGNLYRLFKKSKFALEREDYTYIHIQHRTMGISRNLVNLDKFKILANRFLPLEFDEVNINNYGKVRKRILCNQYFKSVICSSIKKFLKISKSILL